VKKKLIEVVLPLEAINRESAREKEPFTRNHPRSLHIWWARRPLAHLPQFENQSLCKSMC